MSGFEGLLAGRVLVDRYRVEEVIGRGGMGAVYRAIDERLGREVAVKVITVAGGADPEARERIRARFRHEAASAARLPHHPHVVPVYDYGTDPALGLDFLVMELLRGEDLASRLARSGPPPLPIALRILRDAASGVAVGHRAGVIHRDVKPGNVFLVRSDDAEELQIRVLDFGIAKLIEDADSTQLTQDGRAPLSPAYASPEQLRGDARVTPASDVFSLGAIGFQMLTGERPFSEADRNRMAIGQAVPLPDVREHAPGVPPFVAETIARALAADPAERFPTAGALADGVDDARRRLGSVSPADFPPPGQEAAEPSVVAAAAASGRADEADADRTAFAAERTEFAGDGTLLAADEDADASAVLPPSRRRRREGGERSRSWLWIVGVLLLLAGGAAAWIAMADDGGRRAPIPLAGLPDSVPADSALAAPAGDPVDALMFNQEGIRALEGSDYLAALARFEQAVAIAPDNPEYRRNYGYALLQSGAAARAADELETAIGLDPAEPRAYGNLADARMALGDTVAAAAALRRVLELRGDERMRAAAEQKLEILQRPPEIPLPNDVEPWVPEDSVFLGPEPAEPPR